MNQLLINLISPSETHDWVFEIPMRDEHVCPWSVCILKRFISLKLSILMKFKKRGNQTKKSWIFFLSVFFFLLPLLTVLGTHTQWIQKKRRTRKRTSNMNVIWYKNTKSTSERHVEYTHTQTRVHTENKFLRSRRENNARARISSPGTLLFKKETYGEGESGNVPSSEHSLSGGTNTRRCFGVEEVSLE